MSLVIRMMQRNPRFCVIVYVIWIIVAIGLTWYFSHFDASNEEFSPYSANVVSVYTDKLKRGGMYHQNIVLDNENVITANAFSSMIAGQKTMLINYIAVGDSIVRNTFDTIYVYRDGSESYVFTYNKDDYK